MKRKVKMLGFFVASWFAFAITAIAAFLLWDWVKLFLDWRFRPEKKIKLGAGGRLLAVWRSNILAKLIMPYVITSVIALLVFLFLAMLLSFGQTLRSFMLDSFDMTNWIINFKWSVWVWIISNAGFVWYWRWRWYNDKYIKTTDGLRHISANIPILGLLVPFLPQQEILIDSYTKDSHVWDVKSATDAEKLTGEETGFLSDTFSRFLSARFDVKDIVLLSPAKRAEDVLRKISNANEVESFIFTMIGLSAKQQGRQSTYEGSASIAEVSVRPWNIDAAIEAREEVLGYLEQMFPDGGEVDLFLTEDTGVFSEFCRLAKFADIQDEVSVETSNESPFRKV